MSSRTYLTHLVGRGLEDDRYVVERFQAMANGDIRPVPANGTKAKRSIVSLRTVKAMRPGRTEIIICTGLRTKGGVQIWGDIATGLFHERRQRG